MYLSPFAISSTKFSAAVKLNVVLKLTFFAISSPYERLISYPLVSVLPILATG